MKIEGSIPATGKLTTRVVRGQNSWSYFYVGLGFALSIEGTLVSMATPLAFPSNIATYLAVGAITIHLFLFNRWFQNKLISWKASYEGKAR